MDSGPAKDVAGRLTGVSQSDLGAANQTCRCIGAMHADPRPTHSHCPRRLNNLN